jgi:hypothetical protein
MSFNDTRRHGYLDSKAVNKKTNEVGEDGGQEGGANEEKAVENRLANTRQS